MSHILPRSSSCTFPESRPSSWTCAPWRRSICFSREKLPLIADGLVRGGCWCGFLRLRLSTVELGLPDIARARSSDALSTTAADIDAAVASNHNSHASEAELTIVQVHEIPRQSRLHLPLHSPSQFLQLARLPLQVCMCDQTDSSDQGVLTELRQELEQPCDLSHRHQAGFAQPPSISRCTLGRTFGTSTHVRGIRAVHS